MSEQTQADTPSGRGSRARRIGSRIVVISFCASVLLTIVQALGPESWRAGNPVFGPEGQYIGPPPSDAVTPAEDPAVPTETTAPPADADATGLEQTPDAENGETGEAEDSD